MTPEGEHRLRSFVSAIIEGASVPRTDADGLIEEMLGHLVERVETLTAEGATEDDAIRTATAEFGDAGAIGLELGRTYHSQLWASTVGVLLTAREVTANQPRVVGAIRLLLVIQAILAALIGASALLSETPVRALVAVAASAVFIAAAALAHRALGTGHAWALTFGVGVAAVTLLLGVVGASNAPAGTTIIPIGAVVGAWILAWVARSGDALRSFVASSPTIGPRRGSALAAALLVPAVIGTAWPGLPDPTQATAADVDMTVAMDCGRKDLDFSDGPIFRNHQFVALSLELVWNRVDALPNGIGGGFRGDAGSDTAGFRLDDPQPEDPTSGLFIPGWTLYPNGADVHVAETGQSAGWWGSSGRSGALIPETMGAFTVATDNAMFRVAEHVRISWTIGPSAQETRPWPDAQVAFAHLDRFVLFARVRCGERVTGSEQLAGQP